MYIIIFFDFLHTLVHLSGSGGRNGIRSRRFAISNFAICSFLVTDDTCDAYYIRVVRKKIINYYACYI